MEGEIMKSLMATKPTWYKDVAPERQGLWAAGASKWHLGDQASYGERVRIVLKDGTVLDGVAGAEKNRWDAKHAIAMRIPGRKSQKWVLVTDIAVAWGDKGRPFEDLLTEFIVKNRDY